MDIRSIAIRCNVASKPLSTREWLGRRIKGGGVQLIGYSPLALGLLTDKYSIQDNKLPTGIRGLISRISANYMNLFCAKCEV